MISRRSILSMIGLGGAATAMGLEPAHPGGCTFMMDREGTVYELVDYPSEDSAGLWRLADQPYIRWHAQQYAQMKGDSPKA